MAPAALPVVEGLDPNALALILQFVGSSPMAVGLFFGLWLGGRAVGMALKLVLEAKSDAAIRAVIGLTMAIKGATQQPQTTLPLSPDRRPAPRVRRTGPNPTISQ